MLWTKRRFHWTNERRNYLREMWPQHGATYIARMLGCCRTAVLVESKRMMLGKPRRVRSPWSPEAVALLRELWPLMSCHFIAERLGMSPKAVRSKARRLNLPFRWPALHRRIEHHLCGERWWPKEKKEEVRARRLRGQKIREIAKEMGVTPGAISGQVRRLGLSQSYARPLSNKPQTIERRDRARRGRSTMPLPTDLAVALPAGAPKNCQYVYGNPLRFCTNKRAVVAGRVSMYCEEHGIRIKPTARTHEPLFTNAD